MGDHRLPKRVMSGELENAGKRGPGGKEKEWTDCVADDLRLFGVTGDWKTAALDPGAWYNTVQEGGCRFMAAWVREEENASNQRQKKRDAEEADKVEVAPGVTVASLRRFRTALIGPTQGPLSDVDCAISETETLRVRNVVDATRCFFVFFGVHGCEPGRVSDGSRPALCQTLSIECRSLIFL